MKRQQSMATTSFRRKLNANPEHKSASALVPGSHSSREDGTLVPSEAQPFGNSLKGGDTLLAKTNNIKNQSFSKSDSIIEYIESTQTIQNLDDLQETMSTSTFSEDAEVADSISLIMENVVNSYMDPLVVINAKGSIKNINKAFLVMFGYERWEIASKNIKKVIPDEIARRHDYYIERYVKSRIKKIIGEPRTLSMKRKDGSMVPVLVRVNELKDRDGVAFFAVVRSLEQEQQLQASKELIMSMLPKEISIRMEAGESNIADEVEATAVFVDIVDFTKFVTTAEPLEVVQLLSRVFGFYDEVCQKYELERIKTIGSIYMAVCGVSQQHKYDHASRVLEFAVELIQSKGGTKSELQLTIGVASGKMIAGVIQGGRVSYDIWGDTVNISSRCHTVASPDGITVNERTYNLTRSKIPYSPVVMREIKGKGMLATYDVNLEELLR